MANSYQPKNLFIDDEPKSFSGHTPRNLFIDDEESKQESPRYKDIASLLGGLAVGGAQGVGDLAANVAQAPGDAIQYLFGHGGYKIDHPNWKQYAPHSGYGQSGEKAGEFLAPLLGGPALAPELIAGEGLYGGAMLPRLLSSSIGAAAQSPTGERKKGAALGLGAPIIGKALRFPFLTPFTQRGANKGYEKLDKLVNTKDINNLSPSTELILNLQHQLQSPALRPVRHSLNTLLADATEGTYPGYRNLQSALGDIARDIRNPGSPSQKGWTGMLSNMISPPQTTAQDRLIAKELEKLRGMHKEDIAEKLANAGHSDVTALEKRADERYKRYKEFEPWKKRAAYTSLGALITALGIPGAKYLNKIVHSD